jgi:hypothetical protein
LLAGLGSSSKSDADCFGRAGKSSSPKRDMVVEQWQERDGQDGKPKDRSAIYVSSMGSGSGREHATA